MKIYRIIGKRGRITIPHEIRKEIGFVPNDLVSFETNVIDDHTVIVKREAIYGIDDECEEEFYSDEDSEESLLGFIDSLSEEEQRTALIHLSVKWAERQGD